MNTLPAVLHYFALINPLSYGVDAFKHILFKDSVALGAEFSLSFDIAVLSVFSAVMIVLATRSFEKKI